MQIYIGKDGQQLGPYSLGQLQEYLNSGSIGIEDFACYDGQNWVSVAEVPGVYVPQPQTQSAHDQFQSNYAPVQGAFNSAQAQQAHTKTKKKKFPKWFLWFLIPMIPWQCYKLATTDTAKKLWSWTAEQSGKSTQAQVEMLAGNWGLEEFTFEEDEALVTLNGIGTYFENGKGMFEGTMAITGTDEDGNELSLFFDVAMISNWTLEGDVMTETTTRMLVLPAKEMVETMGASAAMRVVQEMKAVMTLVEGEVTICRIIELNEQKFVTEEIDDKTIERYTRIGKNGSSSAWPIRLASLERRWQEAEKKINELVKSE